MLGPLSQQKLGTKYLLGELLGQGGFGSVYKAQNLNLNRLQAIKILQEHHFATPAFRARFIREAQVLAALSHPNILPIYDFEIEERMAYLVMPFIGGGTLQTILKQQGALSLETTGAYLQQICAALQYAHERNVVHLDLKPLNLLHQDGTLLLSDFGLAHLMKEGAIEGGTSLGFGSPHYMAPEHLRGEPQVRSDIYALGIILYQMLTGQIPFHGTTPEAVMIKHLTEPPPLLRVVRPDLPVTLDGVLNKALAKRPEERYDTAGRLLDDFKQALISRSPNLNNSNSISTITGLTATPANRYTPPLDATVPAGKHEEIPPLPPPPPNWQAGPVGLPPTQSTSASRVALPGRGAILTASFLMLLAFAGGIATFLSPFLIRSEHLLPSMVSLVSSLATLALAITTGFGGYLQNRFGPRTIATVAGILYGLSVVILALAPGFSFIALAGLLGGIGNGLGYIVALTMVLQWFPERRGLVVGLVLAGSTLGSFVISSQIGWLGSSIGWRFDALGVGLLCCIIIVIAAQLLRAVPQGDGPFLSAYGNPQQPLLVRREYTLREALLNPVWYILWFLLIITLASNSLLPVASRMFFSSPLVTFNAALVASAIGGRFLGGWLSDVLGRSWTLLLLFGLQMLAWGGFGPGIGLPPIVPLFIGELAFSGCLSVLPAMTADVFGAKNVGTIYGTMMTAFIVGNFSILLIPLLGIYMMLPIMVGIMLVGMLLAFVVRRLTMKPSLG